jgi:hypothetical protein
MNKDKIRSVSWKIINILEKEIYFKHYDKTISVSKLKIERSFVNQIENNLYEKL